MASKYYRHVTDRTEIKTVTGCDAIIPIEFKKNSSHIISRCSFLQNQIQKIIFITHGPEVLAANKFLLDNPQAKARMDFLCSIPYGVDDPVLSSVFDYSRVIFRDIYDLRCVLAHENWMSCDDYAFEVLFSRIDEEARLLKATARLMHHEESTSREVFNAILRYIRKIKFIGCDDLRRAVQDLSLCEWILMTISHTLTEKDPSKREELRKSFLLFRGTSHIFGEDNKGSPEPIEVRTFTTHKMPR